MTTETKETPTIDIIEEKKALCLEKTEIAAKLAELGIPLNQYNFKPHTIPVDKLAERKKLASRYTAIEKRLFEIKTTNSDYYTTKDHTKMNIVSDILIETFGRDFKLSVHREMRRRINGEPPTKVSLPETKNASKTYKQEFDNAIEMLIKARYAIDLYIQENEPSINKADYLIKISKINRSLPSLQEIKKLKPL